MRVPLRLWKRKKEQRERLFNVLRLLTIAEVGSGNAEGYLSEKKFERHTRAVKAITDALEKHSEGGLKAVKDKLEQDSRCEEEARIRLVGLAYAFVDAKKLDTLHTAYEKSVERALRDTVNDTDAFSKKLARLAKLSYGLQWLQILAGGKDITGRVKHCREIVPLVCVLEKLADYWEQKDNGELAEVVFTEDVRKDKAGHANNMFGQQYADQGMDREYASEVRATVSLDEGGECVTVCRLDSSEDPIVRIPVAFKEFK